jgi:Flp pilus assembly protein TadD
MKMNVGLLTLALVLIVSCGSPSKKSKTSEVAASDDLNNGSFRLPPAKKYNSVDDFLDNKLSDQPDVLSNESLSKVPVDKLEEPEDVSDALKSSLLACYRKNFKLADRLFDQLYREYRSNPIYWSQVGTCFLMRGSKRKALLYFNKAKDLKRNYAPPINNIGVIFQKEGFDQKALKAYEEAKNLSSFSLTPLFNIAQIYTKYGLLSQGKELFSTLVNLNNKDQDSLYALGYLEMVDGKFQNAVSRFNRLQTEYRRRPEVGVNVAYALFLAGNAADAKDVLEEMLPSKNNQLNSYIGRIKNKIGRQ